MLRNKIRFYGIRSTAFRVTVFTVYGFTILHFSITLTRRQVFNDFLQYMDIDEASPGKTEYLQNMKNNYQKVISGLMSFDLEKNYDRPVKT